MTHEEKLRVARATGYISFTLGGARACMNDALVRLETAEDPFSRGLDTGLKIASRSMIAPLRDAIELLDPLWKGGDGE